MAEKGANNRRSIFRAEIKRLPIGVLFENALEISANERASD